MWIVLNTNKILGAPCKNGSIYSVLQYKQLDLTIVLLPGILGGKGAVFALNIIVKNEHLNIASQGRDCVQKKKKKSWDVTLEMPGAVTGSSPCCCHLNSLEPGVFTPRLSSQLCHELIPWPPRSRTVGRARDKEQPEGTKSQSLQQQAELSGSDLKPAAGDSLQDGFLPALPSVWRQR